MKKTEIMHGLQRRLRQGGRRTLAGILTVSSIISLMSPVRAFADEVQAADPDQISYVSVDETLYVNLDAYGTIEKANVVKGFVSSKQMEYTDYGTYSAVLNMSDRQELKVTPDSVSFLLDGSGKRFFMEGKVDKDEVELPWQLTVSYKLNGVPVEAERLRGASGTVEIDIKAVPNKAASTYMQNNLILAALIPVDEQKIYSVDAPGAQTQSIGDITGVMFTALPGEEKEFAARLGTDAYESIGVVFLMFPASSDSFESITDIKDLKDTWRSSGDAMYDSMDDMLSIVQGMRGELDGVKESLRLADDARGQLSASKESIFNTNEQALQDLNALGVELQKLIPYLASAQSDIHALNDDVNALVADLDEMQSSLTYLSKGLGKLADGSFDTRSDLSNFSGAVKNLSQSVKKLASPSDADALVPDTENQEQLQELINRIEAEIDRLLAKLPQTAFDRSAYGGRLDWYTPQADEAGDEADDAVYDAESVVGNDPALDQAARFAQAYGLSEDAVDPVDFEVMEETLSAVTGISGIEGNLREQLLYLKEQLSGLSQLPQDAEALSKSLSEIEAELNTVGTRAGTLSGSAEELLSGAGRAGTGAQIAVEDLQDSIGQVTALNNTVNNMYPTLQNTLTQLQAVLGQSGTALNGASNALLLMQATLRSVSDTTDASLAQGIESTLLMVDRSLSLIDATARLQQAGGEAKDTLDEELDKYEEENNVLNMDPHAEKPSFTSEKNQEPASIQIVLRTAEIELPDDEELLDGELPASDVGILGRLKAVFVQIVEMIKGLF